MGQSTSYTLEENCGSSNINYNIYSPSGKETLIDFNILDNCKIVKNILPIRIINTNINNTRNFQFLISVKNPESINDNNNINVGFILQFVFDKTGKESVNSILNISGPIDKIVFQNESISFNLILGKQTSSYSLYAGTSFHNGQINRLGFRRITTGLSTTTTGTPVVETSNLYINNDIENPIIIIKSQSLIDFSNIGDTTFEIRDKFYYYSCSKDKQVNNLSNQIYITKLYTNCIDITSVINGIGNNTREKVKSIYILNDINIELKDFCVNFIEYTVVKYLLCYILYGKFNIKYLLQKYYLKFLKDLNDSRFYRFVNFFTIGIFVDYYKYFI